jgi:hypothetical protein
MLHKSYPLGFLKPDSSGGCKIFGELVDPYLLVLAMLYLIFSTIGLTILGFHVSTLLSIIQVKAFSLSIVLMINDNIILL